MSIEDEKRPVSQLYSDLIVVDFLGDIEIDGHAGLTKLDAAALKGDSPDADAKAHRFELISAIRGGKHVELGVTAQTFEQTAKANRRFLRLADDKLATRAPSWKGQPYLTDHNTYSIKSSQGMIMSSKAIEVPGGMAFEQKLNAVTVDATIGILNGTFNKFSIGWWPSGPVLCSAHGCDISARDSCNCWPGDEVTLEGNKKKIVEFVFTDFRGKETSTVVLPAVQNTSISDVRAALAAELNITRTRPITRPVKENAMLFHRLAVALGLSALSEAGDEDRAVAAVSALQARANAAETNLAATRASLAQAESAVKTLTAAQLGVQVGSTIEEQGFAAGKLRRLRDQNGALAVGPVELWIRKLGADAGLEVMKAQLEAMPVIVPIGERQAAGAKEPALTVLPVAGAPDELTEQNPYLINAAQLTGQKVGDLVAFAKGHMQGGTP